MSWLNINTGVIGIFIVLTTWAYFSHNPETIKINPLNLPWVPIDVRKNKVYVSMTKDASMFTERSRRVAIIGGPRRVGYKDSTNGYLEAGLTSLCVCPTGRCPVHDDIYDADGATPLEDVCVLDGNGNEIIDAGNADTVVCGV
jgi:hypothetical protein